MEKEKAQEIANAHQFLVGRDVIDQANKGYVITAIAPEATLPGSQNYRVMVTAKSNEQPKLSLTDELPVFFSRFQVQGMVTLTPADLGNGKNLVGVSVPNVIETENIFFRTEQKFEFKPAFSSTAKDGQERTMHLYEVDKKTEHDAMVIGGSVWAYVQAEGIFYVSDAMDAERVVKK